MKRRQCKPNYRLVGDLSSLANLISPVLPISRIAILAGANKKFKIRLAAPVGSNENVVDIRFTITGANTRCCRTSRSGSLGALKSLKPTIALFLLNRSLFASLVLFGFTSRANFLSRPTRLANDT